MLTPSPDVPQTRTYRERSCSPAVAGAACGGLPTRPNLVTLREAWDVDEAEPISDFRSAGDRVAVRFIWHGAGRGPDADLELTQVNTVRGGRIFAIEYFWDHPDALEALGLSD